MATTRRIEGIEGAEQLRELGRKLRAAGDRDLRRALLRGLRDTTKPAKEEARSNARNRLPRRGGLAQLVANSKISTRTKLTGTPRVQLIAQNQSSIRAANAGQIRHPVFGRDVWVTQRVTPGWWSDAMKGNQRRGAREMARVVDEVSRKLRFGV